MKITIYGWSTSRKSARIAVLTTMHPSLNG